jgi:predicted nucleic acid-binding protein
VTDWLLDTNILSELRRPKPDRKVAAFVAAQALDRLLPDVGLRTDLADWLVHQVRPMFEQRVLPVSEDILFKWRLLVEQGRKAGHTYSQPDLFIAATALHHGLTVVTRDTADYAKARVPLLNPWIDPAPRNKV